MTSLTQHIKKVLDGTEKKSLLGLIFSMTGLKFFADGNVAYMKLVKGYNHGTYVGEDHLGNKYYENDDLAYGRKRWVVYKDTFNYNTSGIPPEWHGWLHQINDYPPTKYEYKKPAYGIEAYITRTGTTSAYAPKGSWLAGANKRNWKKVEPWEPPKQPGASP